MAVIRHTRVPTDGQSLDAQIAELTAAGSRSVLKDIISGGKSDRAELAKALKTVAAGDDFFVVR